MNSNSTNANVKPYYGDLEKTKTLDNLFSVKKESRDDGWRRTFLENVADASFSCGNPQVITGPDSYPYFQLNIPEPNKPFQCFVIRHMKDDFLMKSGVGVVINRAKGAPDWVFSYGDIVNFHIRNEFYTTPVNRNLEKQEVIKEKEQVLVGQPSETVLPNLTRAVLREHLKRYGIQDCKILLMNRKKADGILQELVFNLTPDHFGSEQKYQGVMQSMAWFLPRHYTYVSMEEASFKDAFRPL